MSILSSIEGLIGLGLLAGIIVGILVRQMKYGCLALMAVPVCMIVYIDWWQGENADKLRSTSALDFVFGPLWPSLGAIIGLILGQWLRDRFLRKY